MFIADSQLITGLFYYPIVKIFHKNPNIVFNLILMINDMLTVLVMFIISIKLFKTDYFTGFLIALSFLANPFRIIEYSRFHGYSILWFIILYSFGYFLFKSRRVSILYLIFYILSGLHIYVSTYYFAFFLPVLILVSINLLFKNYPLIPKINIFILSFFIFLIILIPPLTFFLENKKSIQNSFWLYTEKDNKILNNSQFKIFFQIQNDSISIIEHFFLLNNKRNYSIYISIMLLLFILSLLKYKKKYFLYFFIPIIIYVLYNVPIIYKTLIKPTPFIYFRNYFRIIYPLIFIIMLYSFTELFKIRKNKSNNSYLFKFSYQILTVIFIIFYILNFQTLNYEYYGNYHFRTQADLSELENKLSKEKNKIILFLPIGIEKDIFYLDKIIFMKDNYFINAATQHFDYEYAIIAEKLNKFPSLEAIEIIKKLKVDYIINTMD